MSVVCTWVKMSVFIYFPKTYMLIKVPRDFIGAILTVGYKRIESTYTFLVCFENLGKYTQTLTIIKYYAKNE